MKRLTIPTVMAGVLLLSSIQLATSAGATPGPTPSGHTTFVYQVGWYYGLTTYEREVPTGDRAHIEFGWATGSVEMVQEWLDDVTRVVTVDGKTIIPRQDPIVESEQGASVLLHAYAGPLSLGDHLASVTFTYNDDVNDAGVIIPAGTVVTVDRLLVVTQRFGYPHYDYSDR